MAGFIETSLLSKTKEVTRDLSKRLLGLKITQGQNLLAEGEQDHNILWPMRSHWGHGKDSQLRQEDKTQIT